MNCKNCGAPKVNHSDACDWCKTINTVKKSETVKVGLKVELKGSHAKYSTLSDKIVSGNHLKIETLINSTLKGDHLKVGKLINSVVVGNHVKVGVCDKNSSVSGNHCKVGKYE